MKELCITHNDLNHYIEGNMSTEDRDNIEHHLIQCKSCLELLINVKDVLNDPGVMAFANDPISEEKAQNILMDIKNKRLLNRVTLKCHHLISLLIKNVKIKCHQTITTIINYLCYLIFKIMNLLSFHKQFQLAHVIEVRNDRHLNEIHKKSDNYDELCFKDLRIMIVSKIDTTVTIQVKMLNEVNTYGRITLNKRIDHLNLIYESDDNSPSLMLKNNCVTFKQPFQPGYYRLKFDRSIQQDTKEYYFYINQEKGLQKDEKNNP